MFEDAEAETLTTHATLHRLEFGRQRGFGSVKVTAQIGETRWKSSVFPQKSSSTPNSGHVHQQKSWLLLVSRKVMRLEGIDYGDEIQVTLTL